MGEFSKKVLTTYVESECKRQLYLLMGEDDSNWMKPLEKIIPLSRNRIGLLEAQKLGNKYQQKVYTELKALDNTQCSISPYNNIVHSSLKIDEFDNYYFTLVNSKDSFCLLEKRIDTPKSFLDYIFEGNSIFENEQKYVLKESERLIPDIILLGNSLLPINEPIYELLTDGTIREVPENELQKRFALNIIDIKMTNKEKVNKRQFIEIVFYLSAFTHFLENNNLKDRFFVNVQISGILPLLSSMNLRMREIKDLMDNTIPCNWVETKRVFDSVLQEIKDIVFHLPCDKNSIELKIQPACGRCDYLDDCTASLNGGDEDPANWDVRLIPYTTSSLSEQMNVRDYNTIKDVLEKPLIVNDPPLPESIYSEMPLIKLKAESLLKKDEVIPTKDQITTVSIPSQYFAPCSISFTIEADPIHNRIFGAGLFLSIYVFKSKYQDQFEDFWSLVASTIRDTSSLKIDVALAQFQHLFPFFDSRALKKLIKILKGLFDDGARLDLAGEPNSKGEKRKRTSFGYSFTYVNDDLTDESEYALVKALLLKLWDLITLCTIIEEIISVQEIKTFVHRDGKEKQEAYVYNPKTAIYYWSYELLDYLEELTERHLVGLLADPSIRPIIQKILNWVSPSESKVKDYQTYKKIYDLRIFAETIIGLPFIINYTWHDVYDFLLNRKQNSVPYFYWTPHFNYMDFNVWFWYLNSEDSNKSKDRLERINSELLRKVRALDRIRNHFQAKGNGLINLDAIPVQNKEIGSISVNNKYHSISHAWLMYNLLSSTVSEMEIYEYRTMYPEYSIGRLNGAEITFDVATFVNPGTSRTGLPRFYFYFKLFGLSSHMKVEIGSTVYLLPNELRNRSNAFLKYNFRVKIAKLDWNDKEKCYEVETELHNKNLYEQAYELIAESYLGKEDNFIFEEMKWYMYPTSIEGWQKKLEKLLTSFNFGSSWLGFRLAYLWKISTNAPEELSPDKTTFSLPEIYYYYPEVLPVDQYDEEKTLLTKISPSPNTDSSQVKAINFCLGKTISGIQGPPGTGKSQTIVALVDEFLERNKKSDQPVRIIITAFSYQALQVLIQKFSESRYAGGKPSKASKLTRVFLRSNYREKLHKSLANDLVRSGNTWKYNGKSRLTSNRSTLEDFIGDKYIIFSVAHQLFYLHEKEELLPPIFSLDLLLVDEASQLPVDYLMSSLRFINKGEYKLNALPSTYEDVNELLKIKGSFSSTKSLTKTVFVGDHNQLPPVQPVKPPKKLEGVLGSIFSYYFTIDYHNLESRQLEINYRSHEDIVSYTESLGYYQNLRPHESNAKKTINGTIPKTADPVVKSVLEPVHVINAVIHNQNFETSVSLLEANLTMDIILNYLKMVNPQNKDEELLFWTQEVGVVAPHNAQSRLVIRMIHNELNRLGLTKLKSKDLMQALKGTIFSVEKFQGSARTLIIGTIGVSSKDQLMAEEEFLYELTRFNVLTSRAKSKFILICSRNFIDYYPNDIEVLEESTKIRHLAIEFCNKEKLFNYALNTDSYPIIHRFLE